MEIPSLTCKKCGVIDEVIISQQGVHVRADCRACGAFIKYVPQGIAPTLYFGKYKDRKIASMTDDEEIHYLQWLTIQTWLKPKIKEQVDAHLKTV